MKFNEHYDLKGLHAYLGASKYHWINYDEAKLKTSYNNWLAAERGTRLHNLAAELIDLGIKLESRTKRTLNLYVNDAISYVMTPEQVLYYSENCFGTADAICFRDDFLRIHDYKSGTTPAHMEQLIIYAALFCLEYLVKPEEIQNELRIYQNNEFIVYNAPPEEIRAVMNKIIKFDKIISKIKQEV